MILFRASNAFSAFLPLRMGSEQLHWDMYLKMAKIIVRCENVRLQTIGNRANQKIYM